MADRRRPLQRIASNWQSTHAHPTRGHRGHDHDLRRLANEREDGVDLSKERKLSFYICAERKKALVGIGLTAAAIRFGARPIETRQGDDGKTYYMLIVERSLVPQDLEALFSASTRARQLAGDDANYAGWRIDSAN